MYLDSRQVNAFYFLLSAIGNFIVAFMLFSNNSAFLSFLPYAFMILFGFNTLKSIINFFVNNDDHLVAKIISFILNLVMFILMSIYPLGYRRLIAYFLSVYAFILGFVYIGSAYYYNKNKLAHALLRLSFGLISLVFGFFLAASPHIMIIRLKYLFTAYFIFQGVSELEEFVEQVVPDDVYEKIRNSRLRVFMTRPALLSAVTPGSVFNSIGKFSHKNNGDMSGFFVSKSDEEPNCEIMIHMMDNLVGRFGHIDLSVDDTVYTFGNYDAHSFKLGGLFGDGVFQIADKKPYIDFSLDNMGKKIVAFGIHITEDQKKRLEARISKVLEISEPFRSDYQIALENAEDGELVDPEKYNLYADNVYKACKSKLFKVKTGIYKTYFAFNSSCVRFTTDLITSLGINDKFFVAVMSPGLYYEFLNRELKKNKSFVISRKIYM